MLLMRALYITGKGEHQALQHETDNPSAADSKKDADRISRQKIVVSLVIALVAVAHMIFPKYLDQLSILIFLVAIAPWLIPFVAPYISHVELFGAKVDLLEQKVNRETKRIHDHVNSESQRIDKRMDQLYLITMSDKLFTYLEKLSAPQGFGSFYVSPAMPHELSTLEDLGFVQFKPPLRGVEDFIAKYEHHADSGNLSDYVEITASGKSFYDRTRAIRQHQAAH